MKYNVTIITYRPVIRWYEIYKISNWIKMNSAYFQTGHNVVTYDTMHIWFYI